MNLNRFIQIASVFLITTANLHARPADPYLDGLQARASEQLLWTEPGWLNLLHYRVGTSPVLGVGGSRYSSFVDDDKFFLAEGGKNDPAAEMAATLSGFFSDHPPGDDHPLCRYPARLAWLDNHLNIDRSRLPRVECPLYQQWRSLVDADSVVLVFPAHHLNSPSSMFGHTLLRLDTRQGGQQSDWLAYAVNFGANVPASDNSLLYAFRGLTGGYPGQFIVAPYFKKIQEYNRDENRDIWEYPLNLSAQETDRLVTHLWELKEINFDYFFFTENCSYRLLELLQIARPSVELTDEFLFTAIPIDTVRSVERAGLIAATNYRPSLASELTNHLTRLPDKLHPLVARLAEDVVVTQTEAFTRLSRDDQYLSLQAAYQAVRYQQGRKVRDQTQARNSLALLAKLNEFPVAKRIEVAVPVAPQKSHQSRRLALTVGRDADRNYTQLDLRLGYHSLLDNSYGFLKGAQINMANTAIRHYEDGGLKLERLDLADVFSLTKKDQFFDALSWRVYGGLERINVADRRPLAAHITGGGGYAFDLRGTTVYGLLSARVEHNRDFDDPAELAAGGELGWLYKSAPGTGLVTLSGLEFSGGEQRMAMIWEQNMVLSVNTSLRFRADRRWYDSYTGSELSLGYHVFFR